MLKNKLLLYYIMLYYILEGTKCCGGNKAGMRDRGCQKDTVSNKVVKEGPQRSYHLSKDLQEMRKPAWGISRGREIQAVGTARAKALR